MAEALRLTVKQRRERVRWSRGRKQRFLAALAETCDIEMACAAATLDWLGICQLQAMDPQFAADWDAVIASHYARIEAGLLREAGAAKGKIVPALARELLKQRGALTAARKASAAGTTRPPPKRSRDEIVASLMSKIDRFVPDGKRPNGHGGGAGVAADAGGQGSDGNQALPAPPRR